MKNQRIAHLRKKHGEPQRLWRHLEAVSKLAGRFAGKIALREASKNIGLLHHLREASKNIQPTHDI